MGYDEAGIRIVAPNITPDPETGIGKWSDDAIARAIREGIAADGSASIPVMPYETLPSLCRTKTWLPLWSSCAVWRRCIAICLGQEFRS